MKEKKDNLDIELSKLLKEQSHQETSNEWFTRRVLNKLPAKQDNTARHVGWAFYAAAVLVCAGFWLWMLMFNDMSVITVRDIIYTLIASILTLVLTFTPLVSMFKD